MRCACGKTCLSRRDLADHTRTHARERPFACGVCDYRARTKGVLAQHARTHTGRTRPFACDACAFRGSRRNLADHARTHTGEKPLACDLCDFRSAQASTMGAHRESAHDVGRHRCDYCLGNRRSRVARHDPALDDTVHICRACSVRAEGRLSELQWRAYVDTHIGTVGLISSDRALAAQGGCSLRRPDRLYGEPGHVEVHEHDGGEHRYYTCEEDRITELYDDPAIVGGTMDVFRFNPGVGSAAERLAVYADVVRRARKARRRGLLPLIVVYYFFYSRDNPAVVQNIPHTFIDGGL